MAATIPDSHIDLLVAPVNGVLTTMLPDGQPHMSVVWVDYDGTHVLLSSTLERQKGKNIQHNPRVNIIVIDPKNVSRFIEIRGKVVEITQEGAVELLDQLTQAYTNGKKQHYYGDIFPAENKEKETRVIFKIMPAKVNVNAIFA